MRRAIAVSQIGAAAISLFCAGIRCEQGDVARMAMDFVAALLLGSFGFNGLSIDDRPAAGAK